MMRAHPCPFFRPIEPEVRNLRSNGCCKATARTSRFPQLYRGYNGEGK